MRTRRREVKKNCERYYVWNERRNKAIEYKWTAIVMCVAVCVCLCFCLFIYIFKCSSSNLGHCSNWERLPLNYCYDPLAQTLVAQLLGRLRWDLVGCLCLQHAVEDYVTAPTGDVSRTCEHIRINFFVGYNSEKNGELRGKERMRLLLLTQSNISG